MKAKTIMFMIIGLLFLTIIVQNTQVVSLQLLFWEITMSRIILFPLFILIGFIAGIIVKFQR
ncbi:MAG: DUF1049 domain-containing protein [Nitrospinae bacterium]|nr:DUF1049 domain-containing protein [Nitrospinota bacterium]